MRTPRASMGACMACTARVYPGAFDERALPGARRQLSKGRRHLRRGLLHAGRLRPTRQPRRQRCRLFGGALRCRPAVSRHARVAHSRHQLFVFEPRMPRVLSAWLCLGAVAGFHAPPASGVLPSRARCGGRALAGGRMQAGVATLAVHHSCVHVSLACTCTQSVQVSDTDDKRPSGEGAVNCAWEVCVQDARVCLLQAARSVCAWARVVVRSCIPSVDAASPRSACCMHHTSLIHACTHATSPDHFLYYGQQRAVSRHTLSSPDVAAPELPLVPASAPLLRSPALSLSLSLSHANTRLQVLTPTHARTYTLSPSSAALSHTQSVHTYSLALSPLIPLTGCMLDPSRPIRTRPIRSTAGGAPLQCGRAGCAAAGGYRG